MSVLVLSCFSPILSFADESKEAELNINEIREYLDLNADVITVTINELEYLEKLKNYTSEELAELGYSEDEIAEIVNMDYNQKLLDYSKKSRVELRAFGYSEEEIQDIKEYDGITDALEYAEVRGLFASLAFRWSPFLVNLQDRFNIIFDYEWSTVPIFTRTDLIVFAWQACDSSNRPISMTYWEKPSINIQYYFGSTTYSQRYDAEDNIGYVKYSVPLEPVPQSYGLVGAGTLRLYTQSGALNMYTIQMVASYGHSVMGISPGVSIDFLGNSGISISFTGSVQQEYHELRNYKYDGTRLY